MNKQEVIEKVEAYLLALDEYHAKRAPSAKYKFGADYNAKYIRIWHKFGGENGQRSSFCFVDYEGNMYKCAGWSAPAKGIRGHIDNPPMESYQFYNRGY